MQKENNPEECKTLLISTSSDIRLLKELIANYFLPFTIHGITSIKEAQHLLGIESVDLIMVNSGLVIHEGIEGMLQFGSVPIVVLSEAEGLSRYFNLRACNIHFITRPFEIEKMPEMFMQTYKYWQKALFMAKKAEGKMV